MHLAGFVVVVYCSTGHLRDSLSLNRADQRPGERRCEHDPDALVFFDFEPAWNHRDVVRIGVTGHFIAHRGAIRGVSTLDEEPDGRGRCADDLEFVDSASTFGRVKRASVSE